MRNFSGDPQELLQSMLRTEGEKGDLSVHLSAILIWVITLQIEHFWSTLLAEEHNEVCRWSIKQCENRGIYLGGWKKKNQRHWLAWPSSHPVCWNQIRERGPCRKGCSAPGLLDLTDIPPTGTRCRLISSANGGKLNISAFIWSLSDTVHMEEQLKG